MFGKKKKIVPIPKKIKGTITSREYKIYMKEEQWAGRIATIYEKMARKSSKIVKIEPGKKMRKKLQDSINFAHLNIKPEDSSSFAVLAGLGMISFFVLLMITAMIGLPGLDMGLGLIAIFLSVPLIYFLMNYPIHMRKTFEVKTGSEIVSMILYMAIYLRDNPNLEGALRFAADNLTGPLAYELRKLVWDIEIGKMSSVDEALIGYASKWAANIAFVESLQTMRESIRVNESRRQKMLDDAVDGILKSTSEKADKYNRDLKMPIMAIHAMGIILPIMGLVLFPVISIFLDVPPIALFIGYDIVLPMVLLFLVFNVLETRPPTFSSIDVSANPNASPKGKIALKTKNGVKFVSALPIALIVAIIPIAMGIYMFIGAGSDDLLASVFVIAGLAAGLAVYYLGISANNLKIRKNTRTIEGEFRDALFRLGNEISGGRPIETALERSLRQMNDNKIKEMFRKTMDNIKNMGMTFAAALFDKQYGSVRFYPSNLIRSIMKTVVESTKKGLHTASAAMLSISDFLGKMHSTQVKVEENLADITGSLQFQAFFLSPMVSGIVVTMAIIVINILEQIGPQLTATGLTGGAGGIAGGMGFLQNVWANVPISPGLFQLIV
ncbi:hypothetical protein CL614_04730, partial [archaeon]|nr:hypothetical protein [archaeon]